MIILVLSLLPVSYYTLLLSSGKHAFKVQFHIARTGHHTSIISTKDVLNKQILKCHEIAIPKQHSTTLDAKDPYSCLSS